LYPLFIKTEPGNVPADGTTFSNGTVAFQHGSDTQGYRNYVGGNNTTLRNLDLSGTHDGLSITENVKNIVVDNVCVHDLAQHTTIAHNDGMEIYVGRNITLHNVILDNTQPDENQANSAINFTDEGGDIDNVLLDQVTLSTIKGCTIYLRGDGDGDVGNHRFDQTKVTNIRFRNVRIARWGTRDGRECRFSYYNAVGAITEWTNVTGPDGRLVPEPKSLCTDPQGHETPCAATQ
jgi:pectate lyase